jgi:hypothetical protein
MYNMSRKHYVWYARLLFGVLVITMSVIIIARTRHESSSFIPSVIVSSAKSQYEELEPILIKITITNPFRSRISIKQSTFLMTQCREAPGFYIYNDRLRDRLLTNCPQCFRQNYDVYCGVNIGLAPQKAFVDEIKISSKANLPSGSYTLPYELRIPYRGSERLHTRKEFVIDLDGHILERRGLDYWEDVFIDHINGDGEFALSGELTFVVKGKTKQ